MGNCVQYKLKIITCKTEIQDQQGWGEKKHSRSLSYLLLPFVLQNFKDSDRFLWQETKICCNNQMFYVYCLGFVIFILNPGELLNFKIAYGYI